MTGYQAPLDDMRFLLESVTPLSEITALPGCEEATADLAETILEEAGKLASDVLAPLNHTGDQEGVSLENGMVRTAAGFRDAYRLYVESGWNALPFDPDYGGQGLPEILAVAVQEVWQAANMSFALCPLLNQGAVELLQAHGSGAQKDTYLAKMIAGEWTGTMNLTEPQAGSDVGALKTRARLQGNHYLITGQKIFITWGEHDCAENIIHMVLARTPEAPTGTKGISLFLVPKFLVNSDGSLGPHNDLRCVSLEHKLGIHASPTCVMAYGDNEGAIGYLVGEECRGMEQMFTMMNSARLFVGVQGVAIAERAYQQALAFSRERVQGRALGSKDGQPVAIIEHPDVRRMLTSMKAQIEAMRALTFYCAAALDHAKHHPEAEARRESQALADLLTPVTKAWCTDLGCEIASLGVQVHGGMGFIEETGAAQHYRDARITPIYEGTNGIQALDLLMRKVVRDHGASARAHIAKMKATAEELRTAEKPALREIGQSLSDAVNTLGAATDWILDRATEAVKDAAAGASSYLRLFGTVTGGWLTARAAAAALSAMTNGAGNQRFYRDRLTTARHYALTILPSCSGYAAALRHSGATCLNFAQDER